jgi:hypothetical protein
MVPRVAANLGLVAAEIRRLALTGDELQAYDLGCELDGCVQILRAEARITDVVQIDHLASLRTYWFRRIRVAVRAVLPSGPALVSEARPRSRIQPILSPSTIAVMRCLATFSLAVFGETMRAHKLAEQTA